MTWQSKHDRAKLWPEAVSIVGGGIVAIYLDGSGVVDLSYGLRESGTEGAIRAGSTFLTGALPGYAILLGYRKVKVWLGGGR